MMYYMNWKLTNAQIELIASDVSVVDYNYGKKDKKKKKKGEFDDTKADANAVRKAGEEWINRYGAGENAGQGISIGDILNGGFEAKVGVKID